MAQPFISLIKFRRGDTASLNEAIESNVVFEEGEPIYITDSRRMLIGSGELTNNLTVVGNKLYKSAPTTAYTGDLLYEDNFLRYYDGKDWNKILPAVDGVTVTYTEDKKLKALSFNAGNGININGREISVNAGNQFTFNEENKLIIASNAIKKSNLNLDNIFDKAIFNLSTEQISIKYDNTLTITETNGLRINQIPEDIFKSSLDSQLDLRSFTHDEDEKITITDTIKKTNSNDEIIGAKVGVIGYGAVNAKNTPYYYYNGTLDREYSNNWTALGDESSNLNPRHIVRVYTGPGGGPSNGGIGASDAKVESVTMISAGFITLDPGTDIAGRKHKPFAVPVFQIPDPPIIAGVSEKGSFYYVYGKHLEGMYFFGDDNNKYNGTFYGSLKPNELMPEIDAVYNPKDGEWGYTTWAEVMIDKTRFKFKLDNASKFYTLSGYATAITNENYPIFAIYTKTPTQTTDEDTYTYTIYVYVVNYNSATVTDMRLNIGELTNIYYDSNSPTSYNSVIMRISFTHQFLQGKPADFLVKKEINVIVGNSYYTIEPDNIYEYDPDASAT